MNEQNLPTYTHKFLDYPNWIKEESEHYIFFYTKDSEAEKDIELIKSTQEVSFQKIILELEVPLPEKKISYYFYPSPNVKKELMGDDWYAQSIYREFIIHVIYTHEHKPIGPHEDTHLLTLPWGLSWNFLQEGLAEHMVGKCWDGVPHAAKVKEGISKGFKLSPSSQLSSKDWYSTPDDQAIYFYALAGSWVTFLIHKFGIEMFISLYKKTNRNMKEEEIREAYRLCLGSSIEELEGKYLSQI